MNTVYFSTYWCLLWFLSPVFYSFFIYRSFVSLGRYMPKYFILGHKSSLDKFKKIKIIPSTFSDHNAVRLDLNYRRKTIKNSNIWRLNNTLLNNQQITEEIKKYIKMNENENTTTQKLWGHCKSSANEKVHSNTGIPQETRKKFNK